MGKQKIFDILWEQKPKCCNCDCTADIYDPRTDTYYCYSDYLKITGLSAFAEPQRSRLFILTTTMNRKRGEIGMENFKKAVEEVKTDGKLSVNISAYTARPSSEIKDSGDRTKFSTGAVRDLHDGKGRFDLMPLDIVSRVIQYYQDPSIEDDGYFAPCDVFSLIHKFKIDGDAQHLYVAISHFIYYMLEGNTEPKALYSFLLDLAKHYENGAKKYGENNWQKGLPLHSCIDSALRHYTKFQAGMKDEPHHVAFVWNLITAIYMKEHFPELDGFTHCEGECHG